MSSISAASSSTYFTGNSTFAAQLQVSITRAVSIASIPLQQLQSQQNALNGQQSELQTITSSFASIQAALDSLQSSTGVGAFSASVDDPSVANASISAGALAGSYSLDVSSIGSQTNTISGDSLTKVSDPTQSNIDPGSSFTLAVNGTNYTITDSAGTLSGLAQAINNSSAAVQATVVNVGSSSSPDYRLSIQSLNYAPDTVQLTDSNNTSLLNTISTGTNVTYQVNGQPSTPISSTTRSATISTGLNVQFLKAGSTQVTVAQSASGIESALSSIANAYNSITSELNKNRGQNGGALSGDSIIYQLQNTLAKLANFTASNGSIKSLSDIGLTFDQSGQLSFDSSTFAKAASSHANDVINLIGTTTSSGFLQTANDLLDSITNRTTGLLSQASSTISTQLTALSTKIGDNQLQITQLQASLTTRMATADAAISSLENQLTEVTGLFAQMQANEKANS